MDVLIFFSGQFIQEIFAIFIWTLGGHIKNLNKSGKVML